MSIKVGDITQIIENLAPLSYAYKWDNVGLQLGSKEDSVTAVLTTLEITEDILDEAIKNNVNMIVTHHPMIFSPLKNITKEDMKGKLIYKAIKNNISIYAAHTNIDAASGGLNDYIADRLNIKDTKILEEVGNNIYSIEDEEPSNGIGRVGRLNNPKTLARLVTEIKEQINIKYIRVAGDLEATIENVAVINGSGADLIQSAIYEGCQCVITGDVKYHDAQDAISQGINVIDIEHYHSEKFFANFLADYLSDEVRKRGLNVNIIASSIDINPFQTL
ncbi:Nif3-like dinuclear metal center hexameric protein [Alkaliphilus sp. B6464]|uniref:Nif3-like dinuclear metal center hexameric protein n=1 Tax=Alkaliphilus sp. B6464 TaxID=2731219 RepID=UPI001BA82F98|nr:Nif3-like dinuclear metal center hexameric protein [Alkaliphilus sp. B6464]QUH21004.1 Nif3-like dinuclear metal center hexameric protein [Alkaliphilus sp. B6464]